MEEKTYDEFLNGKLKSVHGDGFEIDDSELLKACFPFQGWTVKRALKKGRYAVFADCGLGKTIMFLCAAKIIAKRTGIPVIIFSPLGVSAQTIEEGEKFGVEVALFNEAVEISGVDVQDLDQVSRDGVYLTNYENHPKVNPDDFSAVILDESSILKGLNGKTRIALTEKFKNHKYRLCFTATPAPNDPTELGMHAEFLGICTYQEMLGQFFVNDASRSSKYRLKRHGVQEFYKWVGTWAVMYSKPSDIGFSDEGYNLPPLHIEEIEVKTPLKDEWSLFNTSAVSATTQNQELRITLVPRLEEAAKVINESKDTYLCWAKLNVESEQITAMIPDAVEVSGSDKPEVKEDRLLGFARGDFRVLVTKAKIAQFGLNYQHCNHQVFLHPDFSYEAVYQQIKRSHRFGQKKPVHIIMITTDTMQNVVTVFKRKQHEFERMQAEMTAAICAVMEDKPQPAIGPVETAEGRGWTVKLGDSVQLIRSEPDNSWDYSFDSPPFSSLYTYSDSPEDLSNCKDHYQFWEHMHYLIPEYYRVLKPGRLKSFHLTQLTTGIGRDGYLSIIDFRGQMIAAMQRHGFIFHAEVTIRKSPQLAAIRTKNIQLMHGQTKRDQAVNRPGLADYIITFRKPGDNEVPIRFGDEGMDFEYWCKIAEPAWMDISESDTLQTKKDVGDERHMTPTQLEPIRRCLHLWSNPGDTVGSCFSGIGSEGTICIELGRPFRGFELKKFYFDLGNGNLRGAEELSNQLTAI